jgi:1,4-dihydroxy-2-naphthoate octaprenyltransferase
MKQLSGKSKPKWLVLASQMLAGTVFVVMTISVLPALLLMSLVTALLLIPVLRQVRKEAEKSGIELNSPPKGMVNVTPLHRRLQQDLWKYLGLIRWL